MSTLAVLSAILVALILLMLLFARKKPTERSLDARTSTAQTTARTPEMSPPMNARSPPPPAPPQVMRWTDENGSTALFVRDGKSPDAVLRCTIQTGDNTAADFLDGLVGAYTKDRCFRILMQNDEPDDDSPYWHSWDVPWSEVVQVILRTRSTPVVGSNVRQVDGTYALPGPYLQTRLYKIGRGIECRFLERDPGNSDAPFRWFKQNLSDPEIRFASDTQDNALFGDTLYPVVGDSMDEYALYAKTRSVRTEDEGRAKQALALSDDELANCRASMPNQVMAHLDEFDRWYRELTQDDPVRVSAEVKRYARRVLECLLLGLFPSRYYALGFYENFPVHLSVDGLAKAKVLQVIRWMRPDGGGMGLKLPKAE